jgi:hypothetical protein
MRFDDLVESLLLKEDPDRVAKKWNREDYDYEIFIGDEKGVFLSLADETLSGHVDLIRSLKDTGTINPKNYEVLDAEAWIDKGQGEILGNPQSINSNFSGIILPKQKDIDGTYIAVWSEKYWKSSPNYQKILLDYTKETYPGPYFWDIVNDDSWEGQVQEA